MIGAPNEQQFGKLLDIEMLVVTSGGRERTREEWKAPAQRRLACKYVSVAASYEQPPVRR